MSTTPSISMQIANPREQLPSIRRRKGRLWLRVVEGKSLKAPNGLASRPYCVVQVEKNEFVTREAPLDENTTNGQSQSTYGEHFCNPVWRHVASFDLTTREAEICVTVWDRNGNPQNGEETFLGMARFRPSITYNDRTTDMSLKLLPRTGSEVVHGEIRIQFTCREVENKPLSMPDFDLLKYVGKGSFGKVLQVRKRDTSRVYAMKILNKKDIIARQEVAHTISERNVLAQAHSPFLVSLKYSFQTADKLYLVLDYMNGGELFYRLQKEQVFSEARAKFYTAELVLALEDLHNHSIIYRDLKPENVLLDSTGHVALTDFGLCKENIVSDKTTNTFCGTAEYLAPEVLTGQGYGKAVDWWSLGVLLYEMTHGLPPFYSENTNIMYNKILNSKLEFPPVLSENAKSLIAGLLDRDPKKRLGGGPRDAQDIQRHPFFSDINWDKLQRKQYEPPFKPKVESETDTSNFDPTFTSNLPVDSVPDSSTPLSDTLQENFQGFTFNGEGSLHFPHSSSAGLGQSGPMSLGAMAD